MPAVFQVQSECVVKDHCDPTRPLSECGISKAISEESYFETNSSPVQGVPLLSCNLQDAAKKKSKCARCWTGEKCMLISKHLADTEGSNVDRKRMTRFHDRHPARPSPITSPFD